MVMTILLTAFAMLQLAVGLNLTLSNRDWIIKDETSLALALAACMNRLYGCIHIAASVIVLAIIWG